MRALWHRYVAFWSEREPPESLALLRITFSLALIANLLEQLLSGNVLEFYALPGQGGIFAADHPEAPLSLFRLFRPTALAVWLLVLGQLAAALFLLIGLFTRAAAVVCFIIQVTLYDRMGMFAFGGDNVLRVFLYLLVLAPCGAAWSLDARWRGKGQADVPCWPRRLFVFQLTVLYVTTGLYKIGSTWSFLGGYRALYLALNLPGLARWPGDWAAWVYPLTQIGTFVSGWWETSFFLVPLNMYLRRASDTPRRRRWLLRWLARWDLRLGYMFVGVLFHVCLTVLFDLGTFSVAVVSLYPCLLRPDEARRILDWGARRLQCCSRSQGIPPLPSGERARRG